MTMLYPHQSARMFGVPLMVDPGKAVAILAGLAGSLFDGPVSIEGAEPVEHIAFANGRPSMGRLGDPLGRAYEAAGAGDRIIDRVGACAVIPIEGTLVHKGKYLGAWSGETSYEGVQARIARARRDPSVKGVVFEIDSYGGEVAGCFDTADMIAQLSAEKPTIAILTDFAFSAGYLLASACRSVILPATGGSGSIGAIMLHADYSKALDKAGIKVTVLASGKHKADGYPFDALPKEVAERYRASLDASRDLFAEAVGRYRGGRLSKASALATEAQSYRGTDAVKAGLADAAMRPSDAFQEFSSLINRAA